MKDFTPQIPLDNWAAMGVTAVKEIPEGMEVLQLSGGTYAIFTHRGPVNTFHRTLHHIYRSWLPESNFSLDKRVHFEILRDRYLGTDNPDSEEEVWVPVKEKTEGL